MKILVTGGIGRIGHVTVAHLLAQGHHVHIVDRAAAADIGADIQAYIQGATYHQVDITDYAALRPHVAGIDAVVHLAAIPFPAPNRDAEIFAINCAGTFNIYQAAAVEGIRRVVSASSINALGNKFGIAPTPLQYFPIDEDHPCWTSDVYSFSKQIVEETAAYFWRREAIAGVSMRFPFVYAPEQMPEEETRQNLVQTKQEYQSLHAMAAAERQATLQAVEAQAAALRQQQRHGLIDRAEMFQKLRTLPYRALLFGQKDFWAILDVRDAAHAIQLALTADYTGSHVLHIADGFNATGLPTRDLAALLYPDVTNWKRPVSGAQTLFSIDKARDLLNFAPQYSIGRFIEP